MKIVEYEHMKTTKHRLIYGVFKFQSSDIPDYRTTGDDKCVCVCLISDSVGIWVICLNWYNDGIQTG
jgi:hypothetical protein